MRFCVNAADEYKLVCRYADGELRSLRFPADRGSLACTYLKDLLTTRDVLTVRVDARRDGEWTTAVQGRGRAWPRGRTPWTLANAVTFAESVDPIQQAVAIRDTALRHGKARHLVARRTPRRAGVIQPRGVTL